VWLASDREGHLGVFITAGVGPIPVLALDSLSMPIVEIESKLHQLPIASQAKLLDSVKRPDDFIDLAERGMFVYDWTDIGRTARESLNVYEAAAVPTVPVTIESLPADLAVLARTLNIPGLVFAEKNEIDVRAYLECATVKALGAS
jgi:hypothetical protein